MQILSNGESFYDEAFEKRQCSFAQFTDIEFEECQFVDCDFSEATFKNCKFINCSFERCNLSLVNFSNAKLFDIHFKDSKLVGVDWTKADWAVYHVDFELSFTRCILNDASFFGLTLNELKLQECKLHDVDFREGDFTGSVMTQCSFRHSLFMRTNLSGVDFSDSEEYAIDVFENNIKKAKFTRYDALSLLDSLDIELVD
ncbi:pentapeptide repeat-containing protein [Vibrio sp. SCSIO 43136]|uniref:pentapeptide repeat-containing protein n=1 Tax=Vibrio sp. SCSIO 43136 TaxID=2819101 RepID=UPI0020752CF9|nr:pentapeptide repeat-containing protein [Vibrio sp. SCSIO 43136]USD67899.1 pentapeptide repeat-containing protein [Vibrio sp. SCSIO 43136]